MKYIGRYEVERKLGQGAMGVVFLARDPKLGRQVAIKTFDVGDSPSEDEWHWLRERLLAEGNRVGSLDHPNIVKVYDVVDEGDLAYIVMEFVSGATLDNYLSTHGTLSQDMVLRILRQTAGGLDYAHSKGIIHRDIKPSNLMIDDEGNVKITDFGIAKRAGAATQTGRLMGTPEFMAPEQIEASSDVDGRADQFALATLAYLLLTGQKAFDAETLGSLSHQIVTKDPQPPSRINPQLSSAVDAVFRKAMAKSKTSRYATCLQFVEYLEQSVYRVADPRRPLVPLLIVLLVAVALIGVGAYVYMRSHADNGTAVIVPPGPIVPAGPTGPTGPTGPSGPIVVPAPEATLTAEPSEIEPGGHTTLRWNAQNADHVEIRPRIGPVPMSGSRSVSPDRTTEYEITAYGPNGQQETKRWSVTVKVPPVPISRFTVTVAARGLPVRSGESFSEDDPNKGDLGMKSLTCTVHGNAAAAKGAGLKLVWIVDGQPMTEEREIKESDLETPLVYGNIPDPGNYKIRLTGRGVQAETSFTIKKRP